MKKGSFIFGFLVGGSAAAIATLLSTPKSGKEIITKMKNNKQYWSSQFTTLKDDFLQIKSSLKVLNEQSKKNVLTYIEEVKNLVNEWKREIEPHQQKLQEELKSFEKLLGEMEENLIAAKSK